MSAMALLGPTRSAARKVTRLALAGAAIGFSAGLSVMLVASIAYGDWYLIRLPWADLGMGLIVVGLAAAGVAATAMVILEPIGWSRLLALPGVLVTTFMWFVLWATQFGHSGACCVPPTPSTIATYLYSSPSTILVLVASTAAILLPIPAQIRRVSFA